MTKTNPDVKAANEELQHNCLMKFETKEIDISKSVLHVVFNIKGLNQYVKYYK